MKGYEILTRKDGSKFYLCNTCESQGFGSNNEQTVIIHVMDGIHSD